MVLPDQMKVKVLSLREMLTYGYCPMQWWLRYRLELPWYAPTPEVAFSRTIRTSLVQYFRQQATAVESRQALKAGLAILEKGRDTLHRQWPNHSVSVTKMHYDAVLAFSALQRHYQPVRDDWIGSPIPCEVGFDQVVVKGELDAAYMMHSRSRSRTLMVVTATHTKDPHEDLVRWPEVRMGFSQYVVERHLQGHNRVPLRHMAFPIMGKTPSLMTRPRFGKVFKEAAKATAAAMDVGYSMPTNHKERCRHCPYDKICRTSLISVRPESSRVEELRQSVEEIHEGNPFREESK